jgi:hypothetical protein
MIVELEKRKKEVAQKKVELKRKETILIMEKLGKRKTVVSYSSNRD